MADTTHTPTPWHQGPYYKGDVESREGRICECTPLSSPRAAANAEFIVRAVNAHDDLLAALKDVIAALQADAPGTPLNNRKYDALGARARAAIAKAEATHVG